MSDQEPDMIDMMSTDEVRMACRELAKDVERKRKRIAELEEQLMSAQNDGFDTAKDEFNEKLRSQDKEIERLRSALTVQIRDMKAFKKVLEDDGGFVNAVPAVQKSIDEMQAALGEK